MINRLVAILLFAFASGVAFEYLFPGQALGVNYPVFLGTFIVGMLLFFPERIVSAGRRTMFFLGGSFLFALMVFVRESELLTVLNVLASLGLLALGIESLAGRPVRRYVVVEYIATAFLPLKCFPYFFLGMGELTALGAAVEKRSNLARALKGLLIALPIVGILIILFSSADLVFRKYVTEFFSFDFSIVTVLYFLRVVFVASGVFAVCTYIARSVVKPEPPTVVSTKASASGFGFIETSVVLGSVALVFLAFLLIQFTYLFGGEGAVVAQGFAYAEYARRGFFELIAVSLIAFFLLLATAREVVRDGGQHAPLFKWLAGILILETMLVMVSAFQRLSLYELTYGFTTLRLYSHIFIVWIGTIFLFLGYEIFVREDRVGFAFRGLISMVLFLLVVNILNPDEFIARQNIERYHETGEIDFNYLAILSTDAFPETIKLLDDVAARKRATALPIDTLSNDNWFRAGYQNWLGTYAWKSRPLPGTSYAGWPAMHLARERWQVIYETRKTEIEAVMIELKSQE